MPILGHNHVGEWHPLHVRALVQQRRFLLGIDVGDREFLLLVPENEFAPGRVKFEEVYVLVVVDLRHVEILVEVLHDDGLLVQQLGHDVGVLGVFAQPC